MFSSKALCFVVFVLGQQINSILSHCTHGEHYPHSSNCSLFYQCAHGQLFELSCCNGLHFNPTLSVCDWPENVNCENVTETTTTSTSKPTTETQSTTTTTEAPTTATPSPQICQWNPGQEIAMGNLCEVPQGFFVFQSDGDAVIYDKNNKPLWHTNTAGIGHNFIFQTDGNLVMYSSNGNAVWNSVSHNRGGRRLFFQQDRNLVIYTSNFRSLWNSATYVR